MRNQRRTAFFNFPKKILHTIILVCITVSMLSLEVRAQSTGVPVKFQLPAEGNLPKTYRVTLAITDPKNPDWLLSTFVAGQPFIVTKENKGVFQAVWDGLDDNFMPLPPGTYGVKGIYMPAEKWEIDGQYHSVVPKYVAGAQAWMPKDDKLHPRVIGDPCGAPMRDVDVAPNGIGVFYHQYLENSVNNFLVDLKKPNGYEQVLASYGSGGAAGGPSTCTDGETIWSYCSEGGAKFIYRADQKKFGDGRGSWRRNVYNPEGWVTAMDAWRNQSAGKSFVYLALRGVLDTEEYKSGNQKRTRYSESKDKFVNQIVILDGDSAAELGRTEIFKPWGISVQKGQMISLHETPNGGFAISRLTLKDGLPAGTWKQLFKLPASIHPFDCEMDSKGFIYISDPQANKVYKFSAAGKKVLTYGRLDKQKIGSYDKYSFMSPEKLATWTDSQGNCRLIVVEQGGPNRVSEWSDDGKLLREWVSPQTQANGGYVIDPKHSDHVYIRGQQDTLIRYKVDFKNDKWITDAVWPDFKVDERFAYHFEKPVMLYQGDNQYLAFGGNRVVFRYNGKTWLPSTAIFYEQGKDNKRAYYIWRDSNGDGLVQDSEYKNSKLKMPQESGWIFRYHGDTWLEDFSLIAMEQNGINIWRLPVSGFDKVGNPIYKTDGWQKIITNPIFVAKKEGKATSLFGANEVGENFNSDWAMCNGSMKDGFYVNARSGPNFDANFGAQIKVSRYAPDGKGGFKLKWRTGRVALQGKAREGELYGTIYVTPPTNGIFGVVDNSRCGYILYTTDGLFVEAMFPDSKLFSSSKTGMYSLPGEFFTGRHYVDPKNGKIYLQFGKVTPIIFEAIGWSDDTSPIRKLTTLDKKVTITAQQIATPPDIALRVRGGAGKAPVARFSPAPGGGPAIDGTTAGWESCDPVSFQAGNDQTVEVRCMYSPTKIYLRWHARLGRDFEAKELFPAERIFTHDRQADTLSFYLQGDGGAAPAKDKTGRPGDLRIVFGLFNDKGKLRPIALGMYPKWFGKTPGKPQNYHSPVGDAKFENVDEIKGAELWGGVDADKKGFVISAAIPVTAIPMIKKIPEGMKTLVDFDATFGGHNRFWWADGDGSAGRTTYDEPTEAKLYPGAWAPAEFTKIGDTACIRTWSVIGPWGGPEAKDFRDGDEKMKTAIKNFYENAKYSIEESAVNLTKAYSGPETETSSGKRNLKWQTMMTKGNQQFINLGPAGRLYFAAAWVYVPEDMELECEFVLPIPMNNARYKIGDQTFQIKDSGHRDKPSLQQKAHFAKGWNQVLYRGYAYGYSQGFGMLLHGTPEQLWQVRLSPYPSK